ncbi:MAG: cobalt ECF transporter T component CbiQ [Eubacteriaceae bacterium]|nr:cobalt ECF transporter T component CbiQ [Eubacteriaceae bacterium]
MADLVSSLKDLRVLEGLAAKNSVIHRLHPFAKLSMALSIICFSASFGRYSFAQLSLYLFYPFIMMALAELPYSVLLPRLAAALPFCLFAGIANVAMERTPAFYIGSIAITFGTVSLMTIMLKMYICVMAALIMVATTPISDLSAQLRRLHVPGSFVLVFEITYRYIGLLLEQALSMATAYRLRSGDRKALLMRDMPSFLGQMLLSGFDRAERVYAAMQCRGYAIDHIRQSKKKLKTADIAAIGLTLALAACGRFFIFW